MLVDLRSEESTLIPLFAFCTIVLLFREFVTDIQSALLFSIQLYYHLCRHFIECFALCGCSEK